LHTTKNTASDLTRKYYTSLEMLAKDKHSSLLQTIVRVL
jgi:hypothetical protein